MKKNNNPKSDASKSDSLKSDTLRSDSNGQTAVVDAVPMSQILSCLTAVTRGDFSVRLPSDWTGLEGKVADAINDIVIANEEMAEELERVSTAVGKEGKIGQRAKFKR